MPDSGGGESESLRCLPRRNSRYPDARARKRVSSFPLLGAEVWTRISTPGPDLFIMSLEKIPVHFGKKLRSIQVPSCIRNEIPVTCVVWED
jgi:hypothetical protein